MQRGFAANVSFILCCHLLTKHCLEFRGLYIFHKIKCMPLSCRVLESVHRKQTEQDIAHKDMMDTIDDMEDEIKQSKEKISTMNDTIKTEYKLVLDVVCNIPFHLHYVYLLYFLAESWSSFSWELIGNSAVDLGVKKPFDRDWYKSLISKLLFYNFCSPKHLWHIPQVLSADFCHFGGLRWELNDMT